MSSLFLQGWTYQVAGNLSGAIRCYEEAKDDPCAVWHWNCMDRYGQGIPVNVQNDFDTIVITDDQYTLLMEYYGSQDTVENKFNIGLLYDNRKDYGKSFEYFKLSAKHGYAPAQNRLGFAYENGRGIPIDLKEMLRWYTLSATNGFYMGQYSLGRCYYCGTGVDQNFDEARKWFLLAADQGFIDAYKMLKIIYMRGFDVERNVLEAIRWLTLAAEQNDLEAQKELGTICDMNDMIPEAIKWLLPVAQSGDKEAQRGLSVLYVKTGDYDEVHK